MSTADPIAPNIHQRRIGSSDCYLSAGESGVSFRTISRLSGNYPAETLTPEDARGLGRLLMQLADEAEAATKPHPCAK